MSQSGNREIRFNAQSQRWLFWDRHRECYYYYDASDDTLVFSGRDQPRIPRPSSLSSEYLQNPRGPRANSYSSAPYNYSGSPPRVTSAAYVTRPITASQLTPPTYAQAGPSSPWPATAPPAAALAAMSINQSAAQDPARAQQTSGRMPVPVQPTVVVDRNGMRTVRTHDTRSRVSTAYATGPANQISDPVLYSRGVPSKRLLISTGPSEQEALFSGYSIRTPGHKFFRVGRVFMVLWVEPAGEGGTVITSVEDTMAQSDDRAIIAGRYNEKIFSKVRRFVVIRAGKNFCSALPIVTYGKQGVGKLSVVKSDHAIIYTEREAPQPLPSELPGRNEHGMRSIPIRVVPDTAQDKLDPLSRIDFAKVHTVQHNIKVKAMGMVHPHSMPALIGQFNNVWNAQVITRDNIDDTNDGSDAGSSSSRQGFDRRRDSGNPSYGPRPAQQAQDAYRRMRNRGFTREQATSALVDNSRAAAPKMSEEDASAHVRYLLSQQLNEAEDEDDNDDDDEEAERDHDRGGGMTREEHDDLYR